MRLTNFTCIPTSINAISSSSNENLIYNRIIPSHFILWRYKLNPVKQHLNTLLVRGLRNLALLRKDEWEYVSALHSAIPYQTVMATSLCTMSRYCICICLVIKNYRRKMWASAMLLLWFTKIYSNEMQCILFW